MTPGQPSPDVAVDVHGHYGRYVCHSRDGREDIDRWMSADAAAVAERARRVGIEWTVVSPLRSLFPRGRADAAAGNDEAGGLVPRTPGLRQWVVLHPEQPRTFEQADRLLREEWCVGIKIHPEEHAYRIAEHGRALFAFAARHRAVVLAHSGDANSDPVDFVPLANDFPEVRLILAHIGHGPGGDPTRQVRAIQAARHGNIYADTSSIRSLYSGVIEWAVAEVGADRVLFGTDSPLYCPAVQRARIDTAELPAAVRTMILSGNARRLLRLPPPTR